MTIRPITAKDTGLFFEMMCRLDGETDFMLYEPGERREKTKDTSLLREKIESCHQGRPFSDRRRRRRGAGGLYFRGAGKT